MLLSVIVKFSELPGKISVGWVSSNRAGNKTEQVLKV